MKKRLLVLVLMLCLVVGYVSVATSASEIEAAELPKLATPSDLTWGYTREVYTDDPDTVHTVEFPGSIIWTAHTPCQGRFRINIYRRVNGIEEFFHWFTTNGTSAEEGQIMTQLGLVGTDYVSGTYRFSIEALGDGINYQNSEAVWSDAYTYVKPSAKLAGCTNLFWNGMTPDFEYPENKDHICGYQFKLYYSSSPNGTKEYIPKVYYWQDILSRDFDYRVVINNKIFQEYGAGYYYFKIRTLSDNIEKVSHSEWSALSEPFYLADTSPELDVQIDSIIASNASPEEVRAYAQQLATQELKEAMLADSTTVDKIAELEALANGSATISVDEELLGFQAEDISVIGANLNALTAQEGAALVVGKPEQDHIIPELYDSTLALHFSMNLENVDNPENLKIPVSIKLPVPKNINPEFMVILHYHADGTVDTIRPAILEENEKTYASIVLTSFSDFVMTQDAKRTEDAPVSRLAGAHRYETAFLAANQMKVNLDIEKFDAVVVASGTDFADALSGSYLAAVKNAPILLACDVEWVNDLVKDYIRSNLNEGGTVYILGGIGAIPESFGTGLDGFNVKRLAGDHRFATNLLVLQEAGVGDKPLLISTGLTFADSLSASAAKLPILLVYGDKLLPEQADFLTETGERPLYILGGEGAVSGKMAEVLTAYGTVERVAGNNRFETSVKIAEKFFDSPESAVLAYAWDFPDGLCGGPLATTMNAPLILTMANYEESAKNYVRSTGISRTTILGGEKLIPDTSVDLIMKQ